MTQYTNKYDYIRRLYGLETKEMAKARLSLPNDVDQITITPEDGRLLQILIRLGGIGKIIELGTLGGYSSLWMAAALPADGKIITIEKDAARFALAQQNLAHDPRITVIQGDAMAVLPTLSASAPFDMIFIDADKLRYVDYLDWAERHIRKGGLIVADNTLLFGAAFDDAPHPRVRDTARQSIRAFNTRLADPARYTGILLPTAEGLSIAQKLF
jgi:caffeoyl-CoA O-methyltransferase